MKAWPFTVRAVRLWGVLMLHLLGVNAFAAIAGNDLPGDTDYPNGGLLLAGSTPRYNYSPEHSLFDPTTGYAYIIARSGTGGDGESDLVLCKIAPGTAGETPRLVGPGEVIDDSVGYVSSAIDTSAGYAYVTTYSKFLKISLGTGENPPELVPTQTPGGGSTHYIVGLDESAGKIYLVSGSTFKEYAVGQGNQTPTLNATLQLYNLDTYRAGIVDPVGKYLYLTAGSALIKISLNGGPAQPGGEPTPIVVSLLDQGGLMPLLLDTEAGYGWFMTTGLQSKVYKVLLGEGNAAPTIASSVSLPTSPGNITSDAFAVIPGHVLIGTTGEEPARVFKVKLGAGSAAPSVVGTLQLQPNEKMLAGSGFVAAQQYAYFVASNSGARFIKVDPGPADAPPVRLGATVTNINLNRVRLALADPFAQYTLLVTQSTNGGARIQKLKLASSGDLAEPLGDTLTVESDEAQPLCGVLDATGTYAYICFNTNPGSVTKIALGGLNATPRRVGRSSFNVGELAGISAVINRNVNQAWIGTNQNPGRIIKMALGSGDTLPSRLGAVTLDAGELSPFTGTIDTAAGYAYFGTNTSPGRIVKVALGTGPSAPSRIGAVTLGAGENYLVSSVIDPGSATALFGTYTDPGRIVKVALGTGSALPTRVGAATLEPGEDKPALGMIDTVVGRAYFGTLTTPGRVVSLALGAAGAAPVRLGALELPAGEDTLYAGVLHPDGKAATITPMTPLASAHRVFTSQSGLLKMTRFTLPSFAVVQSVSFYSHAAAGNLRLALYREDVAELRSLVWQSGSVPNTADGAFLTIPTAAGTPGQLELSPGTYHLAWQVDTTANVPSLSDGTPGEGAYLVQPYGAFLPELRLNDDATRWTETDERWSGYIEYTAESGADTQWLRVGMEE